MWQTKEEAQLYRAVEWNKVEDNQRKCQVCI